MTSNSWNKIHDLVESLPVLSSHEHHLPDTIHQSLTLDRILDFSYIGWYAGRKNKPLAKSLQQDPFLPNRIHEKKYFLPSDDPTIDKQELRRQREEYLNRFGYNSYWVWLEKGLQKIYGFEEPISAENWDWLSEKITSEHRDPAAHLRMMKETARYQRAVQDTYWDYSSDLGHPEIFSPTMRVDMFITSCHPTLLDHDMNSPFIRYPDAPTDDFNEYLEFVKELFMSWREKGAVAMKCASAYERSIQFGEGSRKAAQQVFYKPEGQVNDEDRLIYGDFMFNWFCQLNMELDIPFQIHTGLAEISGSNPMLFEPVIRRYPKVRFVLFHAGYPWYTEIAGLAHNYDNVIIDMVWAPIISTSAAVQALRQYIEVAQSSDLIGWGGDTCTSEEAVGAVLAWKYVVAKVLAEMVDIGYISFKKAEILSHKLMYRNNAKIYGFDP